MPKRRRAFGSPLVAVAYVRVSTDDQKLGPEAQRAQIEAWAARGGITIASWHVDQGVSGETPIDKRKGFLEALNAIQAKDAGVLVVAKRDRLARDVAIAAVGTTAAKQCGAEVVSADGTGNGHAPEQKFMRTIVDAAAAYELDLIKARTKAALGAKKARGERTGKVPYGHQVAADGVHLEPHPGEQATIAKARELRATGLTIRALVEELEVLGYVSREGTPFAVAAVHKMVTPAS